MSASGGCIRPSDSGQMRLHTAAILLVADVLMRSIIGDIETKPNVPTALTNAACRVPHADEVGLAEVSTAGLGA